MSKGKAISAMIRAGRSDAEILREVPTTLNSVRWYRSKMRASDGFRVTPELRLTKASDPLNVQEALVRFGLGAELQEALVRLSPGRAVELYAHLRTWNFRVNHTVTTRFGQCSYRQRRIEVHGALLDKPAELRVTLFHELAHALDYLLNGRSSGHGHAWQRIMVSGFRLPPNRCGAHGEGSRALQELRKARAVETWACERCGHEHGIMKRHKYPAEAYKHRGCGGRFQVKKEEG